MSSRRICIPDSAERLIVPVESEFVENLKSLFGVGLFSELKQRLIPLALDILRLSLLGHTHPFETLRGLSDHQWDDLLDNLMPRLWLQICWMTWKSTRSCGAWSRRCARQR